MEKEKTEKRTIYSTSFEAINSFLDKDEPIVVETVCNEIRKAGGIMRVSILVTIKDYFQNLQKMGLVEYDFEKEGYIVTRKFREAYPAKS